MNVQRNCTWELSCSIHKPNDASNFKTVRGFVERLKECSHSRDLKKGQEIHSQALHSGLSSNPFLSSALINMYGKCGSVEQARKVFDSLVRPDTVCWNCLIQGYVENGKSFTALELFDRMDKTAPRDGRTYVAALSACSNSAAEEGNGKLRLRWLDKGVTIHSQAVERGCFDTIVANSCIDMYANCGDMSRARTVFDNMRSRTVVSWTSLIRGYVVNGECEGALELFDAIEEIGRGIVPDARTYVAALTACGTLAAKVDEGKSSRWLEKGRDIHSGAVKDQCSRNSFVQNALIDMYSKCGRMDEAKAVFDGMRNRDAVSWTVLVQGYVENGESELALELFDNMETSPVGCAPSARTFVAALTACASLASSAPEDRDWLERGRSIHSQAVARRCSDNVYVQNTLVDMYAKFGHMQQARDVFDGMSTRSVVSWTALLKGYVENGENELALRMFRGMGEELPSCRTYVAALTACTNLATNGKASRTLTNTGWLAEGERIYLRAVKARCCDIYVETAAINLYAKCGNLSEARRVFDNMAEHNVVAWSCIIQGYVDNGEHELALEMLATMDLNSFPPNSATFLAALTACGSLMASRIGRLLHGEIQSFGLHKDVLVATSLVDFYARCGNTEAAREVFDHIPVKDVCSWNALMSGYSQLGDMQALELFHRMEDVGLTPNELTFTHVLSACNHGGRTDAGRRYFELMSSKYGVPPNIIHYNCMVDLLARANQLHEALAMVRGMPFEANAVTWTAILGGCHKWKNVEVGKVAYESLLGLDHREDSTYVLMANIYGSSGLLEEQEKVLESKRNVFSRRRWSTTWWTDATGKSHKFQS